MVSCPLFPWTTTLAVSDQVQGVEYSESKVETDTTDLELETNIELETDATVLDLETETDVYQEILKQERYSTDYEWSMLKLLLMGQHQ
jgi:hypothetical protein